MIGRYRETTSPPTCAPSGSVTRPFERHDVLAHGARHGHVAVERDHLPATSPSIWAGPLKMIASSAVRPRAVGVAGQDDERSVLERALASNRSANAGARDRERAPTMSARTSNGRRRRIEDPPPDRSLSQRLPEADVAGPRPSAPAISEPNASRYRSTSSSVAGTEQVGPAPTIASHTPRFARYTREREREQDVLRRVRLERVPRHRRRERHARARPEPVRRPGEPGVADRLLDAVGEPGAQHVRVGVGLVGQDLAHRRARRRHRERVAEQRAAGRDRLLLVEAPAGRCSDLGDGLASCRRRRAERRPRSTCRSSRRRAPGPTSA